MEVMGVQIFSEIYGAYYRIVSRLAEMGRVTDRDVQRVIEAEGSRETVLFLPQRILPQKDGSDWGLFVRQADGTLVPVMRQTPHRLTTLQRRWLCGIAHDPRIGLFLDDAAVERLRASLADVTPLVPEDQIRWIDRYNNGDAFTDPAYRAHFAALLAAMRAQELVAVTYRSRTGAKLRCLFLPLAFQFSETDDRFRVLAVRYRKGRLQSCWVLNMALIAAVEPTGRHVSPPPLDQVFEERRCREPAVVRVSMERNGADRFLMEFASYEKQTDRDLATGDCLVKLWYDAQDETEVLIRLLRFGPVLEILGPPSLRAQAVERVRRQTALLEEERPNET